MTIINNPGVESFGDNPALISPIPSSEELVLANGTMTSIVSSNTNGTEGFVGTLYSGFAGYSDAIIVSLIVTVTAIALYFLAHYFLSKAAKSLDLRDKKIKGLDSIIKMIVIVAAITIILFQFSSISGTAAGAISVLVGTVIGFSSRNTISNAIAGIILLSARPFKLGDRIKTTEDDSLLGDVVEITLVYTKIRTIRNELVTIPNQSLLQNQIVNYSGFHYLATAVEISVDYERDKNEVKNLLIEAASNTHGTVSDNPKPYVILKRFDSFAAVYELRAYTDRPNEYLKIESDIRENIYELFQRKGIDLATPNIFHVSNTNDDSGNQTPISGNK